MSSIDVVKVECPICKNKDKYKIHKSVNLMLDKELLESLITGEILNVECTHCQNPININQSILFNNAEIPIAEFVWYSPNGVIPNIPFSPFSPYGPIQKCFTNYEEFITYIKATTDILEIERMNKL